LEGADGDDFVDHLFILGVEETHPSIYVQLG
jgi:hypothetical protein